MKARHRRFALAATGIAVLAIATTLVLQAFRSNLVFFFTPSQVASGEAPHDHLMRIGGLVKTGTLARRGDEVSFIVTDTAHDIPVHYTGSLPDLFREGRGVVAQGRAGRDGVFVASEVLAKHDEKYMPPEAQHAVNAATARAAADSR
jgi:cytochrome c-type biogenesis protein CcmE